MRVLLLTTVLSVWFNILVGQNCKPLSYNDYGDWKDVTSAQLSEDGNYLSFERNPQKGDGTLIIYNSQNRRFDTIQRAYDAAFLPDSKGVVFKIKPFYEAIRKQQLDGIKKDKQLKDSLGILLFENFEIKKYQDVKTFKIPGKEGSLIAWMHEESYKPAKDTVAQDTSLPKKKERKKSKSKSDLKKSYFQFTDIRLKQSFTFDNVTEFEVSDFDNKLAFIRQTNDSIDSTFVYQWQMGMDQPKLVFSREGISKHIAIDQNGKRLSFLYTSDTSDRKMYALVFMGVKDKNAQIVIDSLHTKLPTNWSVSANFSPKFSEDGTGLYFGLEPKPDFRFKDTLTSEEKVSLDIWNWNDGKLQTQQLKNLERDQKKTYLTVYYPEKNNVVPLATKQIPDVRADYKLHRQFLLAMNSDPYEQLMSWEQARYTDVYLINRMDGSSKLLLEKADSYYSLSPSAKYLLYYRLKDSTWNSLDISTGKQLQLTNKVIDVFFDELNDIPNEAGPHGFAGWLNENTAVVYSRNNLWALDLTGKDKAQLLTQNSNSKYLTYRYLDMDKEEVLMSQKMYLSVFDEKTKTSGFAQLDVKSKELKQIIHDETRFSGLIKAKNAERFLFRKETFNVYPDLYVVENEFDKAIKVSNANPQQSSYCWGSVKLVNWRSFAGDSLEGLLYFPANFNADSTYPMVVYFYERHSDGLYRHYVPKPSRSIVNISDYTSRGYFVFAPDIVYETARPGQSAYNAIISGTQSMIERYPQIDSKNMGLQGQSWGGYQTAWLVTRTNMFKAAMAGAPVSNMTSAYGGIRWESGMSRAFQYEEGQSRIGGTLWTNLNAYIENSPLFYADKVETPLLIMSNDADGAVPWYQGIEYFSALRRLQKPSWMLVYNNAPHNLSRRADTEDFTIRMEQFFDHYLKGKPMPEWMKNGIPAIEKGKKTGFEPAK